MAKTDNYNCWQKNYIKVKLKSTISSAQGF